MQFIDWIESDNKSFIDFYFNLRRRKSFWVICFEENDVKKVFDYFISKLKAWVICGNLEKGKEKNKRSLDRGNWKWCNKMIFKSFIIILPTHFAFRYLFCAHEVRASKLDNCKLCNKRWPLHVRWITPKAVLQLLRIFIFWRKKKIYAMEARRKIVINRQRMSKYKC